MKKLLLVCPALVWTIGVGAQKLVIGEKAPEIRVSEWLWTAPAEDGKAKLIEFFHTSSPQCTGRIPNIEAVAATYRGRLTVILLAKEPAETIKGVLGAGGTYFAAIDDGGRTFDAFGVRLVPFCVLVDSRGKVVWSGNPESLDSGQIGRLIR